MSRFNYGLNPPLSPRRGNVLKVLGVARISTDMQDEKSLADQEALYRNWLDQNVESPYELAMIATRGKGERLDRDELEELGRLIDSKTIDLIITEDLGRIVRRLHAVLICEACEDNETRLIALNDSVDTARDDWRTSSMFASMRHEQYNQDTAKRIRRTHRNRFLQGGSLRILPFCYSKPPGAKNDSEVYRIPEMIPVVEEMFRRLEAGQYYSDVADWLNQQNIPIGPGSRSKRWGPQLVRYTIINPLLKGVREFNNKWSKRINKTGKRVAVKAPPEERLERLVPHLAFVAPERYDKLIAMLTARNEKYTVAKRGQHDPRKDRPKKRTRWPGQQIICAVCGNRLVFGAHGRKANMVCNGAARHECWNGITFDAERFVPRMAKVVFDCIASMPDFDSALSSVIQEEAAALLSGRNSRIVHVQEELAKCQRHIDNLTKAICEGGGIADLLGAMKRLESERTELRAELADLQQPTSEIGLPTMNVVRQQALECFQDLALASFEFAREMRQIVPVILAIPVRIADGGDVALRAKLTISLENFIPIGYRSSTVIAQVRREVIVDLFDMPQRAAFRERVVELRKTMTERQAAVTLGLTVTAAQRAAALHRIMVREGLSDPYRVLSEPPPELRRHLHHRYRFSPLPPDEAA